MKKWCNTKTPIKTKTNKTSVLFKKVTKWKKESVCVVQLYIKRKPPVLPSYWAHTVHVKCLILSVTLRGSVFIMQQLLMKGPKSYCDWAQMDHLTATEPSDPSDGPAVTTYRTTSVTAQWRDPTGLFCGFWEVSHRHLERSEPAQIAFNCCCFISCLQPLVVINCDMEIPTVGLQITFIFYSFLSLW